MERLLLDACVVINVFAGGILRSLSTDAGSELIVVEQVTAEVLYVDDEGDDREALEWEPLSAEGTVTAVSLSGAEELTTFLSLVPRLGDGEAASLAAARHRGLVLATDDGLALKIAADGDPVVETVTTPDILSWWADAVDADDAQLASVLQRIETRARYRPPNTHPLAPWWSRASSPS
ncbi:hypothetical protein [Paraconexibacter algicola]|uniref:PIN domain-containing protein n=1 Tax=Paraconexibacter algicola TaxID=2133960 RepID=A0A2T4UH86_9ACTN|nr:hypothetical protein [Paraconexibacter algicola]PTL58600.1 hypothetical protein C7Y72_02465 [Paraconexibacter algicola]